MRCEWFVLNFTLICVQLILLSSFHLFHCSSVLQSQTKHVVYKALQDFPKGVHEVELYERVFDPNCDDEVLCELRNFIPHYQGLFYEPETKGQLIG